MAETVAKAADVYDELVQSSPTKNPQEERTKAMKKLGWARGVY